MTTHDSHSVPAWLWLVFGMVLLFSVVFPWIVVFLKAYFRHLREIREKEKYVRARIEKIAKEQGLDVRWER